MGDTSSLLAKPVVNFDQIQASMSKALEIAKSGRLFFDSSNYGNPSAFELGLNNSKLNSKGRDYVDVYSFYRYLNDRVFGGMNKINLLTSSASPLNSAQKAELRSEISELNDLIRKQLLSGVESIKTSLRTFATSNYQTDSALIKAATYLNSDQLKSLEKVLSGITDVPRSMLIKPENKKHFHDFLKNPKDSGELGKLYSARLLAFVYDKDGKISASVPPLARDELVFSQAEKDEIKNWVEKGKAIDDNLFEKLAKVATSKVSTPAMTFMKSVDFGKVRMISAQIDLLNRDVKPGMIPPAKAEDLVQVGENIGWSYACLGMKVPKKVTS